MSSLLLPSQRVSASQHCIAVGAEVFRVFEFRNAEGDQATEKASEDCENSARGPHEDSTALHDPRGHRLMTVGAHNQAGGRGEVDRGCQHYGLRLSDHDDGLTLHWLPLLRIDGLTLHGLPLLRIGGGFISRRSTGSKVLILLSGVRVIDAVVR